MVDINIINGGSALLFIPASKLGREWIRLNCKLPDYASHNRLPVDARHAQAIIDGAVNDGLAINIS